MKDLILDLAEINFNLNNKVRIGIEKDFQSIKKASTPYGEMGLLIYHLFEAITTWLNRITGIEEELREYSNLSDSKEYFKEWISVDDRFLQFARKNENQLDYEKIISYTTRRGFQESFSLRDILMHISHHSFYHRGQIATLLRLNNFPPLPEIDYI